jgi:hypothetical protein
MAITITGTSTTRPMGSTTRQDQIRSNGHWSRLNQDIARAGRFTDNRPGPMIAAPEACVP